MSLEKDGKSTLPKALVKDGGGGLRSRRPSKLDQAMPVHMVTLRYSRVHEEPRAVPTVVASARAPRHSPRQTTAACTLYPFLEPSPRSPKTQL